jgi:CheY-like chemotaxis protein
VLDWQNIKTWNVLVVDDDPDNCAIIEDVLEFYGMTVKVARNGEEGLEVLQHFTPTLILLDLSMPKMDGWEMFKRVKSVQTLQTVPIVALTAHAMPEDRKRVFAAGFDGYLTKPLAVTTLIEDLRATVEGEVVAGLSRAGKENGKDSVDGLM